MNQNKSLNVELDNSFYKNKTALISEKSDIREKTNYEINSKNVLANNKKCSLLSKIRRSSFAEQINEEIKKGNLTLRCNNFIGQ